MTKFSIPVPAPLAAVSGYDRRLRAPIAIQIVSSPECPPAPQGVGGNPLSPPHSNASMAGRAETDNKTNPQPQPFANAAPPPPAAAPGPNLAPLLEQIQLQVQELENNRRRSLREIQQLAIKLSVAIARQVCLREIAEDDHRVESLIATAIQQLGTTGPLQVHVNPVTHDRLLHGLAASWDSNQIQLVANPQLGLADLQVHSPDHLLEARFEDQFQQIEQQLLEAIADAEIERRQTGTDGPSLQRFPDRRQS